MARARKRKSVGTQRRSPRQERSVDTIAVIFEAVTRILQAEGRGGLNTNRIAEVAGVSVGAIYGYFPNKEAILLAMARRELDLLRDRVIASLLSEEGSDERDPVRRAVRALVKGYGVRGKARRFIMETLFALGGTEDMARPVSEVGNLLAAHGANIFPPGLPPPSPIRLFVLTRAIDNVIRLATYEGKAFVNASEFEDELVALVRGYLAA
jgi:AcrR family transcriptional regulator